MTPEIQQKVFLDRYALRDAAGNLLETDVSQMRRRVANAVAQAEDPDKREHFAERFFWLLSDRFIPGGRIIHSMGSHHQVTANNCYVIPHPHDSRQGILASIGHLMEIQARGGGVGVNLSSLRPFLAYVKGVNGRSSGPLAWAQLYSETTGCVIQGGSRRGATMIMLSDWHPDVYVPKDQRLPGQVDFIDLKRDLTKVTNANISVAVSDAFMQAVKEDKTWDLVFPDINDPDYHEVWDGNLDKWRSLGKPVVVYRTVRARDMWNAICESAWACGEPGVVFMERCRKDSPVGYAEFIDCVNPCGEEPLGPWAVCLLGAVNFAHFVQNDRINFDELRETVALAVRFLDNVIDLTYYPFKETEQNQRYGTRRMGIGAMGLADALIKLKVRYGSPEAVEITRQLYRTMRDTAYAASIELAKERGPFPWFDAEKHLQTGFVQRLPEELREGIRKYGIRNGTLLTQAPTGSTSLLTGVTSGIEPVFSWTFKRRDRLGEHIVEHPLYRAWKEAHPGQPLPDYFVTADELTPEEHVRMQAAAQEFIDASISKTVNAPREHTVEDVKTLYMLAYDLGCKGITYFREGSRDEVLSRLDDSKDKKAKSEPQATEMDKVPASASSSAGMIKPRERPAMMRGLTVRKTTSLGSLFVTVNFNGNNKPFEVFCQIGKAGSDVAAFTEAIARLISLNLRSGVDAEEVIHQLEAIGGSQSVGFGPQRVRSIPDAIALAMKEALASWQGQAPKKEEQEKLPEAVLKEPHASAASANGKPKQRRSYDLCPECGTSMVHEEGCAKCYSCGHSAC